MIVAYINYLYICNIMNKENYKVVIFQIQDQEKKRLQTIAKQKHLSLSVMIREHLKNLTLEPNKK